MKSESFFNYLLYSIFIGIPLYVSITYIFLSHFCANGSGCMEDPLALIYILMLILVSVFILASILKNISNIPKMYKITIYVVVFLIPLLYSWQNIYHDFILPVFFGY